MLPQKTGVLQHLREAATDLPPVCDSERPPRGKGAAVVTLLFHGQAEEIVPPPRHLALRHLPGRVMNNIEPWTYTLQYTAVNHTTHPGHTETHPPVGL